MEAELKKQLATVMLSNANCSALDLLESINLNQTNVTLIFKMPSGITVTGNDWEIAIKNSCQKITNLPILISFHVHKNKPGIAGVKHIIAVASGKGGVGKSSVALSLALAAQKQGLNVGLLDADIFGPSLPTLLKINQKPEVSDAKKIIPHQKYGLKVMSIGFLVPDDAAVIWRGLMVQQATNQLLQDIDWANDGKSLDVLFIDLPPGTGDVQLTLLQKVNLDGAVIVSTPHALALADVKRAVKMFEKLQTTILGCLENMSLFVCPCCNHQTNLFSKDLVGNFCTANSLNYLGNVPHDLEFAKACELGEPFVQKFIEHSISKTFDQIFTNIWQNIKSPCKGHTHG